jgi:PAS domain S-box-containing protein
MGLESFKAHLDRAGGLPGELRAALLEEAGRLAETAEALAESLHTIEGLRAEIRRLQSAETFSEVAEIFLGAVRAVSPHGRISLYLRRDPQAPFLLFACHPPAAEEEQGRPLALPEEMSAWICRERRPLVLPDEQGVGRRILPLSAGQEVIGLALLESEERVEEMDTQALDRVQWLADQTAAALQSLRLLRRVEERQKQADLSALFLENIVESIPNGILVVNEVGEVTLMNRNAMVMFELSDADVLGKKIRLLFGDPAAGKIEEVVEEVRTQGFSLDRALERVLSGGTEISLGVSGMMVRDKEQRTVGVLVICRDMTASRELERLRQLDRMKSEFVNNVSHELRTPLTSIKAYTEALAGLLEDPTHRRFLGVIEEESDRLLEMIENLLNVSRIESGKFRLQREGVSLADLIEGVLQLSKAQSDRHRLVTEISPDLPVVELDRNKMKEVLINLIGNAIKYSPGGGEVGIRAGIQEGNLRIDVRDQGLGISEENQKRVFDQFFRVDSSATAQIGGTGLGLAITRSIVEAHGGRIQVESQLGKGSTFSVLLPLEQPAGEEVDLGMVEQSPFA